MITAVNLRVIEVKLRYNWIFFSFKRQRVGIREGPEYSAADRIKGAWKHKAQRKGWKSFTTKNAKSKIQREN